jgi:hypothetical protein
MNVMRCGLFEESMRRHDGGGWRPGYPTIITGTSPGSAKMDRLTAFLNDIGRSQHV